MSNIAEQRRLAQARRITALKERRSQRVRLEAARSEHEARERAEAAKARHEKAQVQRAEACSSFFQHQGEPQAEVWLIATGMREEQAANEEQIAAEKRDTASDAARIARQEHERLRERAEHIDARFRTLSRTIARCAQDREDEDMQERTQ